MSAIVANIQARLPMPSGLSDLDAGKWRVLCESVFPNAKTAGAVVLALDYCKARKLDIYKRPVNIVPMWSKAANNGKGAMVETIWPSINEVQVTASRTGQYAGMDSPVWGEMQEKTFEGKVKGYDDDGVWQDNVATKLTVRFPESCAVTVYRMIKGVRCPFTEPVFWEETYGRIGKSEIPNPMWAKRARGQLLKVAKAFSIRAAFPEEGEYTAEEMEGREIAAGGVVIDNVEPPKEKSLFTNASLRNSYCKAAIDAFSAATTVDEINEAFSGYLPKLKEMKYNHNEHDMLAADEIHKRYKQALVRLKTPAQEITPDGEIIDNEEDEVPAFIKKQMEEENARAVAMGLNF